MGESCEVHSEDDKALPETNKKRIVKTRDQVDALEKFYDEHKYPSESMKSELAKSIGLTDKQVSGWFCHRRLKDKRSRNVEAYGNGRQDRSSGIIQDRGSGLKQDSCGSTKQGDDRNFDPREVESRRLTSHEYSNADFIYKHANRYNGNPSCPDNTSSGSSSSLRNMPFPSDKDPFSMASSRYQTQNVPKDMEVVKPRTGPSGYLKVKGRLENAAITAVKRQLGRHYREDGPSLGVEFDPLPPGAFESPIQGADNDYYAEEPVLMRSSDVSVTRRNPHSVIDYGYNSKIISHNSDVDGAGLKTAHGSDHSDNYIHQKLKRKSPIFNYVESYNGKSSSMDIREGPLRGMPAFDSQDSHHRFRHGVGGISLNSAPSQPHLSPYVARVDREEPESQFQNYNDVSPKAARAARFEFKPSKLTSKGRGYHGFQDKGPSRRMKKEAEICGEGIARTNDFDSNQLKDPPKSEMRATKRVKNELPQEHHRKALLSEEPSWTNPANQVPRSAAEMPSSFSEDDETAETGSSVD